MTLLNIKLVKEVRILGLLLFSMATPFCLQAQEVNDGDLDSLIDELFFNEKQFLEQLIESDFSYNFIYSSVSYDSNTFFSGRDSGTDQFNIVPQISYYHSSGFNASISGIYYQNFTPSWDFTSVSLGYFKPFGASKNWLVNIGYTKYFYSDGFDDFTNSIDVSFGIRNKKRTLGTTLAGAYIFGTDNSYQLVSNSFVSFNLHRTANIALRFRPTISFVVANQTYTFLRPIRTPTGPQILTVSQKIFNLLNTQFSLPISMTINSWDFELGYNLNLPNTLANETNLPTTSFLNFSVGYLFNLNSK